MAVLLGFVILLPPGTTHAQQSPPPNFVVVMVDDMGYSDLGCYGGEIETPNIDRLAANGARFTQFYNCSRCCQTRASLLTGAYPHCVGMREFGRTMDTGVPTLAENLKQGGYSTAMVGKWHLSELPHTDNRAKRILWMNHELELGIPFAEIDSYPTRRGFEHFYGIVWGVVNHYDPFSLTEGEEPINSVPPGYHATDAISQRAIDYLDVLAKQDRPYFLYVAYTAPHWPIQAPEEYIAKYRGKYSQGWGALRQARHERQQQIGLIDSGTPLGELSGDARDWEELNEHAREYQAEKMAVHAAMIDQIDVGMGRVIQRLEQLRQLENTVIFVMSDNGASPEIPGGPGYDRYSATRDGRDALREHRLRQGDNLRKLGTDESYTGIGATWASAVNTPLRYWKAESYEGGCRTPLVVHWPAGLADGGHGWVSEVGHVMDVAPTCYELAQVTPATGTLQDGMSLAPVLRGEGLAENRPLYFEHGSGAGIRQGKWKASKLARHDSEWQLFDLETDPGETTNLAQSKPDELRQLVDAWVAWMESVESKSHD